MKTVDGNFIAKCYKINTELGKWAEDLIKNNNYTAENCIEIIEITNAGSKEAKDLLE